MGAGLGSAAAHLRRVVNACGGDAHVRAFYDVFTGVTLSGSNVTAVRDARGASGFGPSLTAPGGSQPTWDSVNRQITQTTAQYLTSAVVAAFDPSKAIALVLFGTQPTVANAYFAGLCDSAGQNTFLAFRVTATLGNIEAQGGNNDAIISSTIAASATKYRALIASMDGVSSIKIDVANHTRQSGAVTNNVSRSCALTIGACWPATFTTGALSWRGAMVLDHVPSAGEILALAQFGAGRYGCALAS